MATGDLSWPIDCVCKKFTVQVARRRFVGARLGKATNPAKKMFFLSYRRASNAFKPGIFTTFPSQDYETVWSTECANYGQSATTGSISFAPLLAGERPGGTYQMGDYHAAVSLITEVGTYFFSRPISVTPADGLPYVLDSFEAGDENIITFIDPLYSYVGSPSSGGHFEANGNVTHVFSDELDIDRMAEILTRDLGTPIPCAYSATSIAITPGPGGDQMEDSPTGPAICGVTSADDNYQFLPPAGVVGSLPSQAPNPISGASGDGISGHAGRYISTELLNGSPREAWIARALIYWPGMHSLQTHEFGFYYNFGIGGFGDPPDTPADLPTPLEREDITIACPYLATGYIVEPPEENVRVFWLENYSSYPGS